MARQRIKTRQVRAGNLLIGGDAPVSIQSMTNLPIEDVEGTIGQIRRLADAGADLVRLAVLNEDAIPCLAQIRRAVDLPLSADIHFNYRLAIRAMESGINKVRINPGNIGSRERVLEVVRAAGEHGVPLRIGVNGGSLDRTRYPDGSPQSLADSALDHVKILEDAGFQDIVVSLKSSDLFQTIEANRLFSLQRDYPLHVGLTEAGYGLGCIVQSSLAIGHLLLMGLGDTVRVSMTGDPVEEIAVAARILESVGERFVPVRLIACPTCGRTDPEVNLLEIAREVEEDLLHRYGRDLAERKRTLTVAVMGCEVNGPGEASHADVGIAGARNNSFLLFAGGQKLKKIPRSEVRNALAAAVEELLQRW